MSATLGGGAEMSPAGLSGGGQVAGLEGGPNIDYERAAASYGETQKTLLTYFANNSKHTVELSDTSWVLAAGLPPDAEYGAVEGDIGLGLAFELHFQPRTRDNTYVLTLYHDRGDGAEPLEPESTTYPGRPTEQDLADYDEGVADDWCLLLFAAASKGSFKKKEALFRLPDDHPSKGVRKAMQSYAAAQVAFKAWLAAQDGQVTDGGV